MYLGLDVALATWYNKKQHGFIPKERTIYYETESEQNRCAMACQGCDAVFLF